MQSCIPCSIEEVPTMPFCTRCRNKKVVEQFMDGDKRRRTCRACREYGQMYVRRRSMKDPKTKRPRNILEIEAQDSHSPALNSDNLSREWTEEPVDTHMKFIYSTKWMAAHLELNANNPVYISALYGLFGRKLVEATEDIEILFNKIENPNMFGI